MDLLRVVGVNRSDTLKLRATPAIPSGRQPANIKEQIPSGANDIVDLGASSGNWRLVLYRGVMGYASMQFLAHRTRVCVLHEPDPPAAAPLQPARFLKAG